MEFNVHAWLSRFFSSIMSNERDRIEREEKEKEKKKKEMIGTC